MFFDDINPFHVLNLTHIETETTICKISIMMLWDHGHPYIQSTPVLCDYSSH